jgi:hypothetical protein
MRQFILAVWMLNVALTASPARADAGTSLSTCQKTVAAESAKYVRAVADTVGKCLTSVSTAVVQNGRSTADAATGSAAACVASFGKILNSDAPARTLGARFDAKVAAKCDPAVNPRLQHVEAATYTVGSTTLGAGNLSEYCAALGGDGTLDSFAEWRTCLRAAADREAREAIAVRWPRALEYFEALLPAIAALPVSNRTNDALAALSDLDSAIEGPLEDNAPDPLSGATGLLGTGETYNDFGWRDNIVVATPPGVPTAEGIARAGIPGSYRDNGDGTISDLVTGLTWEKLSDDGTIHHRLGAYTFEEAITVKIAALNAGGGFAGHTDWRLPNRRELESLVDYGRSSPAIRSVFADGCPAGCSVTECSCTLAEPYWTSTSYQPDAAQRWVVDFVRGFILPSNAATARVRAVRGGVTAAVSSVDNPSASPLASLNACQKAVATESSKYLRAWTTTVGTCLNAMSASVIKKEETPAAAANKSASTCIAALGKLTGGADPDAALAERFAAKVAAKCDPAVNPALSHLDADTYAVGTRTLSAATLGRYCASLGGDAKVDSFAKWSGCLRRAADAEAREAIALRWPRALEYFAALRTAIAGLPASPERTHALVALAALDADIEGATDDDKPEPPPAPPAGLLATGQTQCAQADLSMGACPGGLPGQDGAVRAGIAQSYTDNGDGTITDHVTGLMWEKLSDDDSIHDRDHTYRSEGVFLNKLARLNRHRFAGYDDWRVPNMRELESLVDAGRASPAIDPIFDRNCTPGCSVLECSCTKSAYRSVSLFVDFSDGSTGLPTTPCIPSGGGFGCIRVRAVRGGNYPPRIYANQPPVASDLDVKHPWRQDCMSVSMVAADVDSATLYARIKAYPQHGFLTPFADAQIAAAQPDDFGSWGPPDGILLPGDHLRMTPQVDHPSLPGVMWVVTRCYVPFSTTFTGSDSFAYDVVDHEGNISSKTQNFDLTLDERDAIVTISVFED